MTTFIELLKYILLGIVQGFTEILPISSSGHLVIFQFLLKLEQPGLVFEMFTNTASFVALFIFFYKDIFYLIKQTWAFLIKKDQDAKQDFLYVIKLLIAVIPIGIVGLLLKDHLSQFKTPFYVGLSLMLTGSLLFLIYKNRNDEAASDEISFVNALLIGTVQVAAIFPGISRSGSTIIGGLMQKISLTALLKFSFLAYIIISVPTALLGFYELSTTTLVINWTGYTLAFIATFIATYLAAFMVMKKIKTKHLIYFSIYCLVIGVTVATLSFFI